MALTAEASEAVTAITTAAAPALGRRIEMLLRSFARGCLTKCPRRYANGLAALTTARLPSPPHRRQAAPVALRVHMLGALELRLGDERLPPLESARVESLLGYLLVHRHAPQPRQQIAFRLWPDSTEPQARTNLRKVLHHLRRALPEADRFIEVGARTVGCRADAPLWLDVEAFEQAVDAGRPEEAVRLYGGELLEGHYDEWLTDERDRLARLYAEALERLARARDGEQAIRDAQPLRPPRPPRAG